MKTTASPVWVVLVSLLFLNACPGGSASATSFEVVDTGLDVCYDTSDEIDCPSPGDPFNGQDAQYDGNQPSYTLSLDGLTVLDNVTGLDWVASPDTDGNDILEYDKLTGAASVGYAIGQNVTAWASLDNSHRDTNRSTGLEFQDYDVVRFLVGVTFSY